MGRPKNFTCDGDHSELSDKQLRTHYSYGCKDELTRGAATASSADRYATRKALEKAAEAEKVPTDVGVIAITGAGFEPVPEGYVDHFAVAVAPTDAAPAPATKAMTPVVIPGSKNSMKPKPIAPRPTPEVYKVPSIGAARRLRALTNLGHTPKDLADSAGLTVDSVWWLLIAPPARIMETTDQCVTAAFLRMRIVMRSLDGETVEGRNATRARALAEIHDWAGPYDWENIDVSTERPRLRTARRDPVALAASIEQANLDAPLVTAPSDLSSQLRHALIELDEAKAARDFAQADNRALTKERNDANVSLRAALLQVNEAPAEPPAAYDVALAAVLADGDVAIAEHELALAKLAETAANRDALGLELTKARQRSEQLDFQLRTAQEARDRALDVAQQQVTLIDEQAATIDAFELLNAITEPAGLAQAKSSAIANGFNLDGNDEMTISIDPAPGGGIRITLPTRILAR
ncbi:hypothetical protein E3O55_08345 [Cryobacterium sp. MDB1-18-2]|uniref:hypothetical protein n=1 Tax=unclassified Cryobacterium TaxID=2649013 RepID=UPI00106D813B|nr:MULTISPECIES: hypothetical protein [unclassified Cryobacterium]TFC30086.1 hypothetical protein E3O55_08345 [Cryobacterium sp. MDB1-18-2]TFC41366.1 hypothetical protein E3O50_09785 [Cryobacterium sp. MDB1-18-1]